MHLFDTLHFAQVELVWGIPLSTWIALAAVVLTLVFELVKGRRTGWQRALDLMTQQMHDLPCTKHGDDYVSLVQRMVQVETEGRVIMGSLEAYNKFLMQGGVATLLQRVETTENSVRFLIETIQAYNNFLESKGTFKSPPSVLVVEDNPADATMLKLSFEEARAEGILTIVETGEQALSILRSPAGICPDYVLLDLRLPGISGQDVLVQMKQDEKLKHIPVIVTTGMDCEDLGIVNVLADHIVPKPVNISHLLKAFRSKNADEQDAHNRGV